MYQRIANRNNKCNGSIQNFRGILFSLYGNQANGTKMSARSKQAKAQQQHTEVTKDSFEGIKQKKFLRQKKLQFFATISEKSAFLFEKVSF